MVPTIEPQYKQYLAYQALYDPYTLFPVFGGGAGGGKSWLGAEWLMTNCYRYPGSRWFIGRNELKRLMMSSYITWQKVLKHHKIPHTHWKLNGQYNYIENVTNGSRVDLLDLGYKPADPLFERFGSLEYTGGWIEEGGEVNFGAFDVLKSRVGRHKNRDFGIPGKILITCNPSKNWIYRTVYKPHKDGHLSRTYAFIQALYGDNKFTADEYWKQLKTITNPATFQRLAKGNWEYDADPSTIIDYDCVVDMFTNTVDEATERYLTVDAARKGGDRMVYVFWKGFKVYKVTYHEKKTLDFAQDRIREYAIAERIPYSHILVDEEGVGGGVVDNMAGIKGFIGNNSPLEDKQLKAKDPENYKKPNYANLRSQTMFMFTDKVNAHAIAIDIADEKLQDLIIEECIQIRQKNPEKEGPLAIVAKDDMKQALGRSPDFMDALTMRMWFELTPKAVPGGGTRQSGGVPGYIPGIG